MKSAVIKSKQEACTILWNRGWTYEEIGLALSVARRQVREWVDIEHKRNEN